MLFIILLDSLKRDSKLCLEIAQKIRYISHKFNQHIDLKIVQTGSDIMRVVLSNNKTIVLHNQARNSNYILLKRLKDFHSKNIVLDSEGCPLWMHSNDGLITEKILKNVDVFFTWGTWQKNQIEKLKTKTSIVECGSYRHQKIVFKNNSSDNNLLILTSSPLANPKFCTVQDEKERLKGNTGLTFEEVEICSNEQYKLAQRICKLIPFLSKQFKKISIRVHPFENEKMYLDASSAFNNIFLSSNEDLEDDFKNNSTVLHSYSTAGIESILSGKKTLVPEYSEYLPDFLKSYYNLVKTGSDKISLKLLENNSFFKENQITKFDNNFDTLNKYYGLDKSWGKGIEIIGNTVYKFFKESFNLNLLILFKRMIGFWLLNTRMLINREPKPKIEKLIKTKDLTKIIHRENFSIKVKEIKQNSGIWEVI